MGVASPALKQLIFMDIVSLNLKKNHIYIVILFDKVTHRVRFQLLLFSVTLNPITFTNLKAFWIYITSFNF
jgi:hypothetical protein